MYVFQCHIGANYKQYCENYSSTNLNINSCVYSYIHVLQACAANDLKFDNGKGRNYYRSWQK